MEAWEGLEIVLWILAPGLVSHSPSLWILSLTQLTVYTHSWALLLAWETSHLLARSYHQRACLGTFIASLVERAADSVCLQSNLQAHQHVIYKADVMIGWVS